MIPNFYLDATLPRARILAQMHPLAYLLAVLSLLQSLPLTLAEFTPVNGQLFSHGLSIIDAPAPDSPFHANANIPIAIEVTGNGKIPVAAAVPGSNIPTRFDLLEIYLTSLETKTNLTIASGASLLQNEPTSSVKHVNYLVPTCVQPGNYNVTFYETSHVNETLHFIITHIPITIDNTSGANGTCTTSANTLISEPQSENNLEQSPFLPSDPTPVITSFMTFVTSTMMVTSTFVTEGVTTTSTGPVTSILPSGFVGINGATSLGAFLSSFSVLAWTILACIFVLP